MNKYIAGFITDTHLSISNLDLNLSVFQQAINVCKKYNIPLFHGGDLLEERKRLLEFDVKYGVEKILELFLHENFSINSIVGNHDKLSYTKEENWLSQFKFHPNLNLVESFSYIDIDDFRIHMLSYFSEKINYIDYLNQVKKNIDNSKKNILLTHAAVNGAINNDGTKIDNSVKLSDFNEFDLILSGHYHQKQKIGKFIYFGSAYQKNYGEDDSKGITLLRNNGELEFIQFEFKKFNTIKIDVDLIEKKDLDTLIRQYGKSEDNIRFEFKGSESKLKSLKTIDFVSHGIDVKTKIKEVEDDILFAENEEVVEHTKSSIREEFEKFCEKENYEFNKGVKYIDKKLGESK